MLGNTKFGIGRFSENQTRTLNLEKSIPPGETALSCFESDTVDPDDLLGSIDLTVDMDRDRIGGNARQSESRGKMRLYR
jgi:hypothetical protein